MSSAADPTTQGEAGTAAAESVKEPQPELVTQPPSSEASSNSDAASSKTSSKRSKKNSGDASAPNSAFKPDEKGATTPHSVPNSNGTSNGAIPAASDSKQGVEASSSGEAESDEISDSDDDSSSSEEGAATDFFDLSNPVRFWNRVEAGLRDHKNPSAHLDNGISALQRLLSPSGDNALPNAKDHLEQLISTGIYSCAVAILNRQYVAQEFRVKCNEFLMRCIEFCVKYLSRDSEASQQLSRVLFRLFLHNFQYSAFYQKPTYKEEIPEEWRKKYLPSDSDSAAEPASASGEIWARMPRAEKDTSLYYVINTNYFHQLGGFTAILTALTVSKSLFETKLLVKVPYAVRIFIYPAILKKYASELKTALYEDLLKYTAKPLKIEDRSHLDDAKDLYLAKILEQIYNEEETQQVLISFSLEAIRQLLKAETLEKRLRGLKDLKRVLERTKKEERKFGAAFSSFIKNAALGEDHPQQGQEPLPKIDPKYVLAWVIANGVMDRFFDILPSHIEILRQGMDLVIFLAQQKELQEDHIEILITNSINMHEHDKRISCQCITTLAPHLAPDLFDFLLTKANSLPLRDYDVYFLELIMSLTAIALKHSGNKEAKSAGGYMLMWKLIQEDANAPLPVASRAFSNLVSLLANGKDSSAEAQRLQFVDLCLENFTKMESIPQSLELVQRILDMYPVKRRKKIIETADEKIRGPSKATAGAPPAGLLPLILMEIVAYKKSAASTVQAFESGATVTPAAAASSSSSAPSDASAAASSKKSKKKSKEKEKEKEKDGSTTPTPAEREQDIPLTPSVRSPTTSRVVDIANLPVGKSRLAHLEHVRLRLRFLEYILCNSALAISTDGVDLLWDCFITQSLCTQEREAAFAFLERPNQNADGYPILPESVLQHIFSNKMLKMDGSQISMAGYRLFERYFVTLNQANGKIKRIESSTNQAPVEPTTSSSTAASSSSSGAAGGANLSASVVALAPDLIGLANLWDIALSSEDPKVADVAVEFLNSLHSNLELAMSKNRALKLRDDYVRTSIDQLNVAANSKDKEKEKKNATLRIERCFILLRNFVIDYEIRQLGGASTIAASQLSKKKIVPSQSASTSSFSSSLTPQEMNAAAGTVKVWLKSASKPSQRLILNPNTTSVRALREKAAEMFGFDSDEASALQFLVDDEKDKELKELDKFLSDFKIADQSSIYIKVVDAITLAAENSSDNTPNASSAGSSSSSATPAAPQLSVSNLMVDSMPFLFGGVGLIADAFKALAKRSINAASSSTSSSSAAAAGGAPSSPATLRAGHTSSKSLNAATAAAGTAPSQVTFNTAPAVILRPLTVPLKMIDHNTTKNVKSGSDAQQHAASSHPAKVLSSQQYFEKCYALLSSDDDPVMCRQVWELLSLLPRNEPLIKQIEDAVRASDASLLAKLFDSKSLYQLTYNLQSAESILARDAEDGPANSTSEWRDLFATAGVVALLIKLILGIGDPEKWTEATKTAAAQLLRVLALLILERDSSNKQPENMSQAFTIRNSYKAAGALSEALIPFLMDVIKFSAQRGSSLFISDHTDVDRDTVVAQEALMLLIPLVSGNGANLQQFCRCDSLQEWMTAVLLKAPQNATRENAARALCALLSRLSIQIFDLVPSAATSGKKKKRTSVEAGDLVAVEPNGAFFLNLLLPALEEIERFAEVCDQYFAVLETLFSIHSSGINTSSLVRKFAKKIIRLPVTEQHATAGVEDKVLIGLMKLVIAIIRQDPDLKPSCGDLLVHQIFHEALFAIPTAATAHSGSANARDPPKCKTPAARKMAFSLLIELAKDCEANFKRIADAIMAQADSIDMAGEYNFSPSSKEKSLCGYIGLQNQGATCYMNSLMQQLYCIPEFRQGILLAKESPEVLAADASAALAKEKSSGKGDKDGTDSVKSSKSTGNAANDSGAPGSPSSVGGAAASGSGADSAAAAALKENLLYQLQRMFAFLQESEKRYFDTKDFCMAYKDPDGKPINTSQQMDANEFFQRLFDLIEKRLKGSNQEHILKSVFGGLLSNQLIPTECPHRREREEPFFNIGVEIKNKSDLKESLQLFVEGELLTGDNKYNCEICQKPVETLKRCCVKKLPPVLVVQLKRFEFDYEKMRNEKLNTACSFPMELDMEPFTKEGLARREAERGEPGAELPEEMQPPAYYQYELAGIVVHTGSADFGHYYSYIRERVPQFGSKEKRWFEFNDTLVTPFDPAKIPSECFGGEEEYFEWADLAHTIRRKVRRQKPYNAYILVYERKGISQPQLTLDQIKMLASPSGSLTSEKRSTSSDDLVAIAASEEPSSSKKQSKKSKKKSAAPASPEESPATPAKKPKKPVEPETESSSSSGSDNETADEPPVRVSASDDSKKGELRKSALRRSSKHQPPVEDSPDADSNTSPSKVIAERISGPSAESEPESSALAAKSFQVGAMAAMFVAKLSVARKKRIQEAADSLASANGITLEELKLLSLGSGHRLTGRRCEVNSEILNSIWEDNSIFLIRKYLFDPDYFQFVWQLSNLYMNAASKSSAAGAAKKRPPSDAVAADPSIMLKKLIPIPQIPWDLAGEVDRDRAVAAAAAAQAQAARETASQSVIGGLSSMASSLFGSSSSAGSGSGSSSIPGTSSKDKIKIDYKGERAAKDEAAANAKERQKQLEKEKAERERREKEREKEKAAGLEDIPASSAPAGADSKKKDKEKDKEKEKEKDKEPPAAEKEKDKEKSKEKKDSKKDKEKSDLDENWTDIGSEDGSKKKTEKDKEKSSSSKKDKSEAASPSAEPATAAGEPGSPASSKSTPSIIPKDKKSSHKKQSSSTSAKDESSASDENASGSKQSKYDPIAHNVEMATRFVMQILSHARDRGMMPYWISSLSRMFRSSPAASRWLLESLIYDPDNLKNILLACPVERIRQYMAKLIFAAIETLAEEEYASYPKTAKLLAQGPLTDPPPPSHVVWFIEKLMTTMLRLARRRSSLNVDWMFWIIAKFARLGQNERHYMLRQGHLVTLCEFATSYAEKMNAVIRYNAPAQQHLVHLLDCVATILLSCKMVPDMIKPSSGITQQPPTSLLGDHSFSLPDQDYEASYAKMFLYTMMREDVNLDAMAAIAYHSCWENSAMSKFFIGVIQDGLLKTNWTATNGFLNTFAVLVVIEDSLTDERIEHGINRFLHAMKDAIKSTNKRAVEKLLAFLIKLANNSENFRKRLIRLRATVNDTLSAAGYRLSAV